MGKSEIVSPESAGQRYEIEPHMTPLDLTERLDVVVHYRRFIVMVALAITALGALYAYSRVPVYEANLLIHVADMRAEPRSLLGEASPGGGYKTAMSEIELLRSRTIIGAAVERLALDRSAAPRYFPVLGAGIAQWNRDRGAPAGQALGGYAWGAEAIRVGMLELPPSMEDRPFTVTKSGPGAYRLDDPRGEVSVAGRLGQVKEIVVGDARMRLRIDGLAGGPGARYVVVKRNRNAVVEELAAALQVDELGRETGMIRVGLQDTDPHRAKAILDEIGAAYMDFLQAQKGQAARESLAVLRAQLPVLEKRVASAEARYERYRRRERAADLEEDTRLQLSRYSATQTRLSELRQRRAELEARLGDAHPELVALDRQIARAGGDGSQVAAGMRRVPGVATELDRLARILKADTDIYGSVLRRIDELSVDVQDQSSNVRILDEAVVPVRQAQSPLPTVLFSALLGVCVGTAGAYVRRVRAAKRRDTLFDAREAEDDRPLHCAHAR